MDNYERIATTNREHAEIAQALIEYQEERVSFSEFYMFCQSFKPEVTVDDVICAMGSDYRGE